MPPVTREDAREFVGGGNREIDGAEADTFADSIAASANAYDRWAESRSLEERIAPRTATVINEDGRETTAEVPPIIAGATTTPEDFGGGEKEADDDGERE